MVFKTESLCCLKIIFFISIFVHFGLSFFPLNILMSSVEFKKGCVGGGEPPTDASGENLLRLTNASGNLPKEG